MKDFAESRLSRRVILLRGVVACSAGAAALLSPGRDAHAAKMPQTSPAVVYQDSPKDSRQCDGCALFQTPNSCQVVDGVINPSGWCKLWVKKAS